MTYTGDLLDLGWTTEYMRSVLVSYRGQVLHDRLLDVRRLGSRGPRERRSIMYLPEGGRRQP